jgi:hypothetical protein
VECIILRAIAPAARDRYTSAAAMLVDLRDPARVVPPDPETGAPRRRSLPGPFRRALLGVTIGVVLTALATLVAFSGPRGRTSRAAPVSTTSARAAELDDQAARHDDRQANPRGRGDALAKEELPRQHAGDGEHPHVRAEHLGKVGVEEIHGDSVAAENNETQGNQAHATAP